MTGSGERVLVYTGWTEKTSDKVTLSRDLRGSERSSRANIWRSFLAERVLSTKFPRQRVLGVIEEETGSQDV